jgi:isopenicillin N synthase-like dioxygenase
VPDTLPAVDVSSFATGAPPSPEQDATAAEIDRICREIGFFLIAGHGVDPAVKDAMFSAMHRFFALPVEEKLEIAIGKSANHRGYVGIAAEKSDEEGAADLKESLDTGGEHGPDHPGPTSGHPTRRSGRPGRPTASRGSRRRSGCSGRWPVRWASTTTSCSTGPAARSCTTCATCTTRRRRP